MTCAANSLSALLRELGAEPAERWHRQARVLDKLYAPTRYPDVADYIRQGLHGPAARLSQPMICRPL